MFFNFLFTEPIFFFIAIAALVYGITIHEFSHVFAAYLQGDNTGKDMNRLTLNPLAHLDLMGTIMLLVAGFGWGKPAPYNPYNLKNKKWGSAIVAIAGPLSNFISLIVFGLIHKFLRIYTVLPTDNLLFSLLYFLAWINLVLLVFNLIPIPPLDGSKILFTLLPDKYNDFKYKLAQNGPMILIGLIMIDYLIPGISIFGSIFRYIGNVIYWLF